MQLLAHSVEFLHETHQQKVKPRAHRVTRWHAERELLNLLTKILRERSGAVLNHDGAPFLLRTLEA